jgi:hypothetical protein
VSLSGATSFAFPKEKDARTMERLSLFFKGEHFNPRFFGLPSSG